MTDGKHTRIGEMLRSARALRNLELDVLALDSGLSEAQIRAIESGQDDTPPVEVLQKLEEAMGMAPGSLSVTPRIDASLERFLESETARSLAVTRDEQILLRGTLFKDPSQPAPIDAWADLVRAIRTLRG